MEGADQRRAVRAALDGRVNSTASNQLTGAIPLRKGQNYAPLEPLLRLGEGKRQPGHYLCDALKERYKHFWNIEALVRREMARTGELVGHFLAGDQLLDRNPWTGGWLVIKPQRQDASTQRALNLMQFYVTNCLTKWMLSNPDVVAKPGRDDDRAAMGAKAADTIVAHYESKFYKPWFNLQEALQALTFGTYINRVRYDAGVKGVTGLREIVENRTVTLGDGAGYCGDCGYGGLYGEFARPQMPQMAGMEGMAPPGLCPQCGSEAVLLDEPPSEEIPTVVGQEPVELGEIVLDSLPLAGCWWDIQRRAEWSSWFIHQQKVSLGAVKRLLGNVKLPGEGEDIVDIGQQVIRGLGYSGQALGGSSNQPWRQTKTENEQPTLVEMWLSPEDYADIRTRGDEQTVGGEPLPPDAQLDELFPDGLVAVGLNGFAVTLGVYAERHSDHITSGVWHMRPLSGAGRGVTDMVEVQRRFNKLDSQQLAYMDAAATPAVLHDQSLIGDDEAGYLGNPRANIPVNLTQLPETRSLAQSVLQLQPASVPGQFVQYVQQFLTQAFSTTSHVTDFTNGGIVGERNDTARAAMIADANANSVFGPLLSIKGETRQRVAEMTTELYRECFPLKRFFALGGVYSEQQGIWLSGMDIPRDILFEVVRESELPQNSLTKQDKVISFFMLFGGFEGYQRALAGNPDLVAELSKLWNVNTQATGFDASAQVCRRRLEQVRQGYKMLAGQIGQMNPMGAAGQMAGPQMGTGMEQVGQISPSSPMSPAPMQPLGFDPSILLQFIQPPVSFVEKDHPGKANFLQIWLDTDDGLNASLEERAAVELWIGQHFQMAGGQQAALAMMSGQAQAAQQSQLPPKAGPEERMEKKAA